ncbi:MAG TPA: UbiA-like polyprenyltransferase [Gemmatimonadaceae bacterium]|jgi:4-hydroxybenzoate polyprenyltransferase|nr:UbiA-like polyprenyltransferase [Gemmatimonadaceae bacterium]
MTRDNEAIAAAREGQTLRGKGVLLRHANLVRLPHTVFALPFALVGVVLASNVAPISWRAVVWVVIAFTTARFAAMGFNRIVDREIDARNPRTRSREIPSGAMSVREAVLAVTIACVVFFVSAWQLNALCLLLSPLALAWVLFYSYTKRFTRWSHLVLGIGLSIAPVGGYLAITGHWSSPWWMLIALAAAVATWVGGFDILYALQDVSFDRENGLYSVPSTFGEANALGIARVLHLVTVAGLTLGGIGAGAGLLYFVGVLVAAGLLLYEHSLVHADDFSRLDAAFFTMNGVISIVFLGFVFTERLLR